MSESDDVAELPTDRAFDLLGDATRRRAVAVLRETDGAMALDELADEVLARDADATLAEASRDRRERAAASLHHCHLPKLDDADVVAYDPTTKEVEVSERVEQFEPYFEVIEGP